jgi:hypothetical protein
MMYKSTRDKSTISQEDVMNTKLMVLAALTMLTAANFLQAQTLYYPELQNYSATQKDRLDKAYANALKYSNEGVVRTALAIAAILKMDLPAEEFPGIRKEVQYLTAHGATPMIRYRACLVEAVFYGPEMFKEVPVRQYSDPDAFFNAFVERMAKPSISAR